MVILSNNAVKKIRFLISQESDLENLYFRIRISGGGCSGFQYHFSLDKAIGEDDKIFESEGVFVVIDETSLTLVKGSIVDYIEDLSSSSFVIKNPMATSKCGCGNSFSI